MADLKISQLPAATTPVAGTEVLPIVQSSVTSKVAISDLTAGRAISATSVTLSGATASELLATDASKITQSLAVATYPSLTEISYVKGVTSAVQTQMNAKAPLNSPTLVTPTLGIADATKISLASVGASVPANGGMVRLSNTFTYFSGKSDGAGAVVYNGDGSASVKVGSPGGSSGYVSIEAGAGTEVMRVDDNLNVGIGTDAPNNTNLLDLVSTTKGLGIMVMTTTQKNAISSPREGSLVYDTTLHKLCIRVAAAWETIVSA